jgi:hypothetical protein
VPTGQVCLKHDQGVKGADISDEPMQIAFMKKDKGIIQPFGTDDTMVSILK